MATKLVRCHNCPRTFVADVVRMNDADGNPTGDEIFPLCDKCGTQTEEQVPGEKPVPSFVERRQAEERERERIANQPVEIAALEARIAADTERLASLKEDRRAPDQDAAIELAFQKGELPEIERRGASV